MTTPLPATGCLDGTTFLFPVRVYYEDTDAGGIVYHANYLRFAERARTEMLRAVGIDLIRLRDEHGLIFVVFRGEITYRKPARLDDLLVVESDLVALTGATASIAQTIRQTDAAGARGDAMAAFQAHVACMQPSGRPARFPRDLRARMESLIKRPAPTGGAASLTARTG
jgi:acyl-CoA thioester hydrolase